MKPSLIISAGTCGLARGAGEIIKVAKDYQHKKRLQKEFDIKITGCHGLCEAEPNVLVHFNGKKIFYQKVKPENVKDIIEKTLLKGKIINDFLWFDPETRKRYVDIDEIPFYQKQKRILLGNNPLVEPEFIENYENLCGYSALRKVLKEYKPIDVINIIKKAGLRGRGGAGFPTGKKWELCRNAKRPEKYVVCNADEGDPGAYMDRSLLEGNPHSVIEGMIIGAYAIGAQEGIIYVRNEYPLAMRNLGIALKQAYKKGFLGKNILKSKFNFEITIVRGAGAFVCGEETALLASIEGTVGRPRPRPPYPVEKGLWGKPTNINNVETWANVSQIVLKGEKWFSAIGTKRSKGTKIFSLVGKIRNTGLVEVPMGITLKEIINDIGGGVSGGKKFKAVQTGGPSGGCIPNSLLNLPVDYESLSQAGSIMGSGGMIVMDEGTCMVDIARYFLNFTQAESCGKCSPCRLGTKQMVHILHRITEGKGEEGDIELLEKIGNNMTLTSLCGLGQSAPNPVLSTIRYFRNEYEEHTKYKRCPAVVCNEIISSPCQYTCPIDTEAQTYIAFIAQGNFAKAYEIISKDNPLPTVVSRVCHHPCESKCRAGDGGDPVSIRALKRFVCDWAMKSGFAVQKKSASQFAEEKVAIVGSGPAGLTAGYYLAEMGHEVTIFEACAKPGGMLLSGIPEYRLPRDVLEFDIKNIVNGGVEIKTNVEIGKDMRVNDLFKDGYKALFIAVGAHNSLKLGIPGEKLEGVCPAMKFLYSVHMHEEVSLGQRVGVIGGGNSAIDAARVAKRLGSDVTVIYRRTKKEMPAFTEEIEHAIDEGIKIEFLTAPIRVLEKAGKVFGIECIKMKLGAPDESGRRRPIPIKGTEFEIELDTLIPAISEQPATLFLKDEVKLTKWHTIVVDEASLHTDCQDIFAGGDAIRGPSTVIEAMRDGKIAAQSIDAYLRGERWEPEYKVTRPSIYVEPVELTEGEVAEAAINVKVPELKPKERSNNFREVESGFTEEMAMKEARRCLRCDLDTKEGREFVECLKHKENE
jgi:NADH-quinone oxidoreductase subunit F